MAWGKFFDVAEGCPRIGNILISKIMVDRLKVHLSPHARVLEDAFYPGRYGPLVGKVDVLYQDISQRDQLRAFIINARNFLKPHSHGILMIKSRSIDITKAPKQIFKEIITQLNDQGFKILEQHTLEPYTKDHLGIIIKNMV